MEEREQHKKPEELIAQAISEGWTSLSLSLRAISKIPDEIAQLTNLQSLYLGGNKLKTLPDSISHLTSLESLDVGHNEMESLPEWICELTNLRKLHAGGNHLTSLPEFIGRLGKLRSLNIGDNQLSLLPQTIGRCLELESLELANNELTLLTESVGELANLESLSLSGNKLTSLPESIGQLMKLRMLDLRDNQLTALPASFTQLDKLYSFQLDDNPLNPALQSAYDAGADALLEYLRSLGEAERRELLYEAKLMFVGEGNVGKTTLLKALTRREPTQGELSTHGVKIDIMALELPHPHRTGVSLKLNAWDFGGQEVYRVTHQFFFSQRSIYLLVWEPRLGVQQCQVEDWLKLIRVRVGSDARVIIVSTHCKTGERIARIDKPIFKRDFGSMIVDFHEVDSLVDDPQSGEKVGIAKLKEMIGAAAHDLEQMGMEFNRDWRESRDELLAIQKPRITYEVFSTVCKKHGMNELAARTLANLMHDLGYIVYYGDDERLKGDVVLQPEWLTKAIGFVLEDRVTHEMGGILSDSRLKEVWMDHSFENEPRYEADLYPFFLRLMEKYDVLYRLQDGNASLVAQHVPQVRPDLPWLADDEPASGKRRISIVCVMDDAPPGLVPWMIVRTHEFAHEGPDAAGKMHRLHWQKGMFLRNKKHGDAILELRDREFHVHTEAVWPEFFINVLTQTLQKLITDNWPGLSGRYSFNIPCRTQSVDGPCNGRFRIDALRRFLEDGDEMIRCQICLSRQNILELVYGFVEEDSREQLARIETRLERGFDQVQQELNELESRLANHVMAVLNAIADESKDGPRLFTIEPVSGNWYRFVSERHRLHLWCEADGCQHPVLEEGLGRYELKASREWVKRIAPYANFVAGMLKTLVPMVAPAVNLIFGPKSVDELMLKDHLDLVKEATAKLAGHLEISDASRLRRGILTEAERSGILALHAKLRELDPHQERLGLRRIPTYTGHYLWLCQVHHERSQPKIPEKIV